MSRSDDKIVSISLNNKEFLNDISTTIKALEQLNEATSGKNIKTTGIENIGKAFSDLDKTAGNSVDSINSKLKDSSSYSVLAENVNESARSFSALEAIALGALFSIGNAVTQIGSTVARALTGGIRSGWQEYNLIIDSTQTLLANTERYGTTIDEITDSLDELNLYADRTIYNFAQMTRNMGYFTTSGMQLDEAQTVVIGMSNLAALFGATNEQLQRAMYQTSQAMSTGYLQAMDWRSLTNATMGGALLQEELINVAALMSGRSIDSLNEWIERMGGFKDSLRYGWLTVEVFEETMRRFAGMTYEEAAAIRDINNNPLSEEEIQRIVELGERGYDAAQNVRTLNQMLEATNEAIGSGWAQTFRTLIGNLVDAKEFWSPINQMISGENGIVSGLSQFRNEVVTLWAEMYRDSTIDDLMQHLEGIYDILTAVGRGFVKAFGRPGQIAQQIGLILEPLTDLAYTLRLDEDELEDISDLVAGLLSPFVLLNDIIKEVVRVLFNAGDAMNEFDTRTGSLVDTFKPIRKTIINFLGLIGRVMQNGVEIARRLGLVQKTIRITGAIVKKVANVVYTVLSTAFILISRIWDRYDITNKLINFYNTFIEYIYSLKPFVNELANIFDRWLGALKNKLISINFTPLKDLKDILERLVIVIRALFDPTLSVTDAIEKLKNTLKGTSIYRALDSIRIAFVNLYNAMKESSFGFIFDSFEIGIGTFQKGFLKLFNNLKLGFVRFYNYLKTTEIPTYIETFKKKISDLYNTLKSTKIGTFLIAIVDNIKMAIKSLHDSLEGTEIGNKITAFVNTIRNTFSTDEKLPEPNAFTLMDNVIKGVAVVIEKSKDVNLEPIERVIDSVKGASDKIKEIATVWMPEELLAKTAEGGPKLLAVLDSVVNVADSLGDIALSHNDLEGKVQAFSERISFLASPSVEDDAQKLNKASELLSMISKALLKFTIHLGIIAGIIVALMTSLSFKSIAEGIEGIGKGINNWAKSRKYKAISKMFWALTTMAAVIVGGVYLLSTIEDFDRVKNTMLMVTGSIAAIIGICILGIELIITSMNSIMALENPLQKINAAKELGIILGVVSAFLNQIMSFIFKLAFIALTVSRLSEDQQESFFKAMRRMTGMFIGISAAVAIITGLIFVFSKDLDTIDTTARLWNNVVGVKTSSIEAAAKAMGIVASAIAGLMLAIGVSMAIIMLSAPNNWAILAAGGVLIGIGVVLSLFMLAVLAMTAQFNETNIAVLEKFNSTLGSLTGFIFVISISISMLTIAFSTLAFALKMMNGAQIAGIIGLAVVIFGMVILFTEEAFAMAQSIGVNQAKAVDLVIIASSVAIMSACISMIAMSLVPLAGLFYIKGFADNIIATGLVILGMVTALWGILMGSLAILNKLQGAASRLLIIAGAVMMMTSTLIVIGSTLATLAALPVKRLEGAVDSVNRLLIIIGIILLGAALLTGGSAETAGIMAGTMLLVAAAMVMMATAILEIGLACQAASSGLLLFATALQILQTVDGDKIADTFISMMRAIPAFFAVLLANFSTIEVVIMEFFRVINQGISGAIETIFNTINNLIIRFITQGLGIILGALERAFPMILSYLHNQILVLNAFLVAECGEGGALRELIVNLGDFLVWAGGYLAEFSVDIISAIIGGLVTALSDTYFFDKLAFSIVNMFMNVKYRIWQDFGIMSWGDLGALIGNAIVNGFMSAVSAVQGWYNNFMGDVATGLAQLARDAGDEDLAAMHESVAESYYRDAEAYANATIDSIEQIHNYSGVLREENREAMELEMAGWQSVVDNAESRHNRNRRANDTRYDDVRARNSYDPSRYYAGIARNDDTYQNAGEMAGRTTGGGFLGGFLDRITGGLGGRSILSILGLDGITDSFSGIGDATGGLGSSLDNISSYDLSGTTHNLETINSLDFNNLSNLNNLSISNLDDDPSRYDGITDALVTSTTLPEDVTQPVITPVIDSSHVEHDIDGIISLWNNRTYDQFALDVGSSMTVREEANGKNATTDGSVSYNYTQIINNATERSPIEVYRDTQSLLRGRIN